MNIGMYIPPVVVCTSTLILTATQSKNVRHLIKDNLGPMAVKRLMIYSLFAGIVATSVIGTAELMMFAGFSFSCFKVKNSDLNGKLTLILPTVMFCALIGDGLTRLNPNLNNLSWYQ